MPHAGDELPLVDEIDITAQRRSGPRVLGHAHAGMRSWARAHAHLHARSKARLAAVDRRHTAFGEPAAPGAVGQDHRLGDDQVERRAALARHDLDALVANDRSTIGGGYAKRIVGSVEVLRLAAHQLAAGLQVASQAMQEGELGGEGQARWQPGRERRFVDLAVELVVAQVRGDEHALDLRFGRRSRQRRFIEGIATTGIK